MENPTEKKHSFEDTMTSEERQTLEKVRSVFSKDCFAAQNGANILKVDSGYALCSMEITQHHKNARGTVMGGAIFTLADYAFAVAANWEGTDCVTLSSQITFLGVCRGTTLFAEARIRKSGKTISYCLIDVIDDFGNDVASISVNGFYLK